GCHGPFLEPPYGRIVLGSLVLLSMTEAYVPTCAPVVAVETTRTAFVVPSGEPSPASSVRVTSTLEVVAFARKAFVRNAVSSRREMSDFGEAGVTKSFAPWAGTD